MLTEAQRKELSEALLDALLRRLKAESEADKDTLDSQDIFGLVELPIKL